MKINNVQKDRLFDENLDVTIETMYINRILNTLSTIPPKYRKRVMEVVTHWIREGLLSFGSDKERFGKNG